MSDIFLQIQHNSTSEEVAHQLEALILEGVLRAGDRLPGERELAEKLGVSRPILRQAIGELEKREILTSRHGGGTFVGEVIGTVFSPQIARLLPEHSRVTRDYLEFRREIEGIAAQMAAERITSVDRERLQELMQRMREAHKSPDFEIEAKLDVEFHSAIGEMTHNLILLHTLRSCYEMLVGGVFENRSRLYANPCARDKILDQHLAIGDAILSGDGALAKECAMAHMIFIAEETEKQLLNEERERISKLRMIQRSELARTKTGSKRRA